MKSKKTIYIIIGLLVIVVFSIAILDYIQSYHSSGDSSLEFESAPAGASSKLDGKKLKPGLYKVPAGNHTIITSLDGFKTDTTTYSAKPGEDRYIGIVLVPNSKDTKNWYDNHPDDGRLAEGINGKKFDQASKDITARYPVVKELPLVDLMYRIDYGHSLKYPNDPTALAFYIRYYSQTAKNDAVSWLKFKGADPDKLEIQYIDMSK